MTGRVAITGVGCVTPSFTGGAAALGAWLAEPSPEARSREGYPFPVATVGDDAVAGLVEDAERRRLSRACQMAVAAARLALLDARLDDAGDVGLVVGTEFGDLRSTVEFADGYLASGAAGLSALLFPNTVMNAMAAATSIAVASRLMSLTLDEPTVAGELAVAHAASAVAAGRVPAALAGGVDQIDPFLARALADVGAVEPRGEGATFVVLEPFAAARARGAPVRGEIAGVAWRALPARPHGVGSRGAPVAVVAALEAAGLAPEAIAAVYASAGGDEERDRWERRLLARALPHRPPVAALRAWLGQHSAAGVLAVAAGAWTARAGRLPAAPGGPARRTPAGPGLVHGVARGGAQVALVVGPGEEAA